MTLTDTGRTNSCHSTTHNQCNGVRCSTTNQTTKFEDSDGNEVDVFDAEEGVEFAEEELERSCSQQIRRTIPVDQDLGVSNILSASFKSTTYQPTSDKLWNSSVILGMAVAMIVLSYNSIVRR